MNDSKLDTNQALSANLKTLKSENLESLQRVYEQILKLLMLDFKDLSIKVIFFIFKFTWKYFNSQENKNWKFKWFYNVCFNLLFYWLRVKKTKQIKGF